MSELQALFEATLLVVGMPTALVIIMAAIALVIDSKNRKEELKATNLVTYQHFELKAPRKGLWKHQGELPKVPKKRSKEFLEVATTNGMTVVGQPIKFKSKDGTILSAPPNKPYGKPAKAISSTRPSVHSALCEAFDIRNKHLTWRGPYKWQCEQCGGYVETDGEACVCIGPYMEQSQYWDKSITIVDEDGHKYAVQDHGSGSTEWTYIGHEL